MKVGGITDKEWYDCQGMEFINYYDNPEERPRIYSEEAKMASKELLRSIRHRYIYTRSVDD